MNAVDSLRYIGHGNLAGMPVKDVKSHAGVEASRSVMVSLKM